jgi:prepilin-type N-terminal cleavage/methylation domain-containing protein
MKLTKLRNQRGFTIIEVLIVLAIAGLIMLVVFLAVPALQRNQRNGGRRTDGSRLAAAANDFVTNSNGKIPATVADSHSIIAAAGTLSNLNGGTTLSDSAASANCAAGTFVDATMTLCKYSAAVTFTTPGKDAVVVATGAQCNGADAIQAGSGRQMAVIYTQETSTSGTYTLACLNI